MPLNRSSDETTPTYIDVLKYVQLKKGRSSVFPSDEEVKGDFRTPKEDYSQFILSWVIHHVNSISKSELANIFGASNPNSDRYMDFINKAKLFESVCKIGSRVDGIRDLPFFELIKVDERFNN